MKKLNLLLLSMLLVFGVLAGCSDSKDQNDNAQSPSTENEQNESSDVDGDVFPVTVEDANGEEITIEKEPEHIVSLIPSNTELAYDLGLGDSIVGVSDHDNYPEDVLDKEKIGGLELNIEKIVSLEPDLVLAHPTNDLDGLEQLEESGITVFMINDATSFDEVYQSIEMMAKATGTQTKGDELIADMKEDLQTIEEKAEKIDASDMKRVYIEISPEPEIYTPGKNTFENDILTLVHAENIAEAEDGWVEMSEEAIVETNPDVIILTYDYVDNPVELVMERKAWQDINAIKDERVHLVDTDLVSRPGPRLVEGAKALGKAIYPEVFDEE